MIHTQVIDTLDGALRLLSEQDENIQLKRYRNAFLYRGMPNASNELVTSLKRNCKHLQKELEPIILRNFTKYAIHEDPSIGDSVWRQMIVGRHHGLPTRLLDWSRSPLIGLHFSLEEKDMDSFDRHDSVVWRIDMKEMHNLLPDPYKLPLRRNKTSIMSVEMLSETTTSLKQYDADMGDNAMVLVEPPSINSRIINQYSYFSVVPCGMDDIEGFFDRYTDNTVRYLIKKEVRWRIRDMLDQLNISERIVYPGLDGLCQWIARHYYVKE